MFQYRQVFDFPTGGNGSHIVTKVLLLLYKKEFIKEIISTDGFGLDGVLLLELGSAIRKRRDSLPNNVALVVENMIHQKKAGSYFYKGWQTKTVALSVKDGYMWYV